MDLLQRVADELEIRGLVARVAQLADFGDLDEYIACWTPDAAWEHPDTPKYGQADILASAVERRRLGTAGPGTDTRHVITTMHVSFEGPPDQAVVESYWLFLQDTRTNPTVKFMGHYRDSLARMPDGWRIARRQVTMG